MQMFTVLQGESRKESRYGYGGRCKDAHIQGYGMLRSKASGMPGWSFSCFGRLRILRKMLTTGRGRTLVQLWGVGKETQMNLLPHVASPTLHLTKLVVTQHRGTLMNRP